MNSTEEIFDYKHSMTKVISDLHTDMATMEIRNYNESPDDNALSYRDKIYIYNIASKKNCTATDLVKIFGVSKAIVSQTLSILEKKGFIVRVKDNDDTRKRIIKIVPEKIGKFTEEIMMIDRAVDVSLQHYNKEELDLATRILSDITKNLSAIDGNIGNKE